MSNIELKFGEEFCAICQQNFNASCEEKVTLREKGLQTVLECSRQRGNKDLQNYIQAQPDVVNVHVSCRKKYTGKYRSLEFGKSAEVTCEPDIPSKKLRSTSDTFEWQSNCFFCGKSVAVSPRNSTHERVKVASTLAIRNNVLKHCLVRMDGWAIEVQGRLESCNDLPAVGAVYHSTCCSRFYSNSKHPCEKVTETGRSVDVGKERSFLSMCNWLESGEVARLYSLEELRRKMIEKEGSDLAVYCCRTIQIKLQERYGSDVTFKQDGLRTIVCLRETAYSILSSKWYADKSEDLSDESSRIVEAAAKLIRAEIKKQEYSRSVYPTKDQMSSADEGKKWLPPLLRLLLQTIVSDDLKQAAIGQCIVQAARPRSVISPILFGLGVELDLKMRSKWLVNQLSRLGFSITYDEIVRFRQSAIPSSNEPPPLHAFPTSFTQWVGDNVDHNTATLDGLGTFHGMGLIAISTQSSDTVLPLQEEAIPRRKRMNVDIATKNHGIRIQHYCRPEKNDFSLLKLSSLDSIEPFNSSYAVQTPSMNLDLLWSAGYSLNRTEDLQPHWSGFMQHVHSGEHPPPSEILLLPIINMNPSDYHCIFSTLSFVQNQAELLNITTPCITFDQPLWLKAVEIVNGCSLNIVCRLGGFHTMMSFLGSVGVLMAGSGLTDALEVCYGPNAISKMMSGKAVARALRGHFLVETALNTNLFKRVLPSVTFAETSTSYDLESDISESNSQAARPSTSYSDISSSAHEAERDFAGSSMETELVCTSSVDVNVNDVKHIIAAYENAMNADISASAAEVQSVSKLGDALSNAKDDLSKASRTAKLWISYLDYIYTLKLFIRAERLGDWSLHLLAVRRMLNLFAATGHNNYAKSARLYLQIMTNLPKTHPWLYEQFQVHGYHTVRRSDRYWAGLWTDLTIEQTLMKSLKSRGGLTHGSGMNDSVHLNWVLTMHRCASVHQAMSTLTQLDTTTCVEHAEFGISRRNRDKKDVVKLTQWFSTNDPFSQCDSKLRCLSNGITAMEKDDVNCDDAEDVGAKIHLKMTDVSFLDIKLTKKDQLKTLICLQKGSRVCAGSSEIVIQSNNLFSRLIVLMERDPDIEKCFAFELTPLPTSLFKDSMMRKPDKAALARLIGKKSILPIDSWNSATVSSTAYVIDGGALLHMVKWPKECLYSEVAALYARFVRCNFGTGATIVFDGYTSEPSTKDHEHKRRAAHSAPQIKVNEIHQIHSNQSSFLANGSNKSQLILLLHRCLTEDEQIVIQASGDADTAIADAALKLAAMNTTSTVTVVADDTDILVLLAYHFKPEMTEITMLSTTNKGRNSTKKQVSVRRIQESIGCLATQQLLVVHALSGCDTTSALFGQGKTTAYNKLANNAAALPLTETLSRYNATQSEVKEAGLKLLVMLYGGKPDESLNAMRYSTYMHMCAGRLGKLIPERLPPTERAATFHCMRVHYQVVQWRSLNAEAIDALQWGWQMEENEMKPEYTDIAAAPDYLLKLICCNCKSTSTNQCGTSQCTCRKNGLSCVSACGHCKGYGCLNAERERVATESDLDSQVEDEDIENEEGTVFFLDDVDWQGEEEVVDLYLNEC